MKKGVFNYIALYWVGSGGEIRQTGAMTLSEADRWVAYLRDCGFTAITARND